MCLGVVERLGDVHTHQVEELDVRIPESAGFVEQLQHDRDAAASVSDRDAERILRPEARASVDLGVEKRMALHVVHTQRLSAHGGRAREPGAKGQSDLEPLRTGRDARPDLLAVVIADEDGAPGSANERRRGGEDVVEQLVHVQARVDETARLDQRLQPLHTAPNVRPSLEVPATLGLSVIGGGLCRASVVSHQATGILANSS